MGFKDLFFVNDGSENKPEAESTKKATESAQQTFSNKFPSSAASYTEPKREEIKTEPSMVTATPMATTAPITPDNPSCAPHLEKIMKLYEDGFDGLNMEGYDFFEYFKMVVGAGVNNGAAYSMAFTMGQSMGATKETLLSQAQFYIDEISKVHKHYVDNGTSKKESVLKQKGDEEVNLTTELGSINAEISRLMGLKAEKEMALASINTKHAPEITEIECKLMANDMARDRILGTINTVVNGIKTNL
jgi:hypothetical protein